MKVVASLVQMEVSLKRVGLPGLINIVWRIAGVELERETKTSAADNFSLKVLIREKPQ